MNLKILLPFRIFAEQSAVSRMVVETSNGSFGLLPNRLDCVAVLVPGILMYEASSVVTYVALDEGVLVKAGADVRISVRRAVGGVHSGRTEGYGAAQFRGDRSKAAGRARGTVQNGSGNRGAA
jgi:F-type H+-transporting ATPase subunit epsilon